MRSEMGVSFVALMENNLSNSIWNTVQFQISTVDLGLPRPLIQPPGRLGASPQPSAPRPHVRPLGWAFPSLHCGLTPDTAACPILRRQQADRLSGKYNRKKYQKIHCDFP